ncbi:MAG: N-acetylmuramoyl-L-alanine amidase family protein [Candidatus Sumerlaeaceae bacterium]
MCAGLGLMLCFHVASPLSAASVTRISWESTPDKTRFAVELDQDVVVNAADNIHNKGFYYVDIYGIATPYKRRLLDIDDSLVRQVESISYPEHGVLRFVFYVKERAQAFRIQRETSPVRLYIDTLATTTPLASPFATGLMTPTSKQGNAVSPIVIRDRTSSARIPPIPEPALSPLMSRRGQGAKKIVVIDPGHGGANQGASSTALVNGRVVYEKELTLQFAYHLKKLFDSSPNMVAVLTRTGDVLVPLPDRVAFAEKQKGDLFISIHMNDGGGNPNARGMEIFYLSEKGADDAAAKAVAERENLDVLTGGSATRAGTPLLAQVLTDLERQKLESWQYESYVVCTRILSSFQQHPYFRSYARGIKSANFVVLKNFYMPAVLLEVGFITNTDELRYLINPKFQKLTAILLYNAINDYFAQTDPTFRPEHKPLSAALE